MMIRWFYPNFPQLNFEFISQIKGELNSAGVSIRKLFSLGRYDLLQTFRKILDGRFFGKI